MVVVEVVAAPVEESQAIVVGLLEEATMLEEVEEGAKEYSASNVVGHIMQMHALNEDEITYFIAFII